MSDCINTTWATCALGVTLLSFISVLARESLGAVLSYVYALDLQLHWSK